MARKRKANFVVGETKNHQMNGSASSVSILPTSSGNEDQKKEKELKWTPQLRRIATQLHLDRADREKITIWRRPLTTFHYFFRELICLTGDCSVWIWSHRKSVAVILLLIFSLYVGYSIPGPHQMAFRYLQKRLFWSAYWVGLGILSSVGLGTGLHTFLLYLGPHIASVTLAAYECASLNFPEPPYPDEIICPQALSTAAASSAPNDSFANGAMNLTSVANGLATTTAISLWAIMSKVRLEAFMWGAGTALGELPPYFMARAARLTGQEPDDDEYYEFEALLRENSITEQEHWTDRAKLAVEKLVERVGFLGILLCASIPNPLFDLAGITCGHFLVPFWTFFGATLIGKAVVKMNIQQLFVIFVFSEHHVERITNWMSLIPTLGPWLQKQSKEYLRNQKRNLHRKPGQNVVQRQNWLQKGFELLVALMIGFFILSLINSLAQKFHKRVCKARDKDRPKFK